VKLDQETKQTIISTLRPCTQIQCLISRKGILIDEFRGLPTCDPSMIKAQMLHAPKNSLQQARVSAASEDNNVMEQSAYDGLIRVQFDQEEEDKKKRV
jgi:hypothetical protein